MKRFNRFELKYILDLRDTEAVSKDLLANMRPDGNGDRDGSYAITSVYYDTADLAFMRAKIEGIKFRRKLRVRRYGAGANGLVYVEIKQRINRTTQKRRLIVPERVGLDLCNGELTVELAEAQDKEVAEEIQFLSRGLALQPTALVGYQRQAFVGGEYEPGLRVTFDRDMWAADAARGLDHDGTRHGLATRRTVIMEVKANDAVPLWLANLLARHNCTLQRYSKYCAATQKLLDLQLLGAHRLLQEKDDNQWMN
jgi:SPX domain protein involved in polyphosphate accumulation